MTDSSYGPFGYDYISKIKTYTDAGVTADGNIPSLGKDIKALLNYADVLWTGSSNNPNLNTNGNTLGHAYFYPTLQQCTIDGTNTNTTRYIYVNNVPKGVIPNSKGLLPGIIEDLSIFIPTNYMNDLIPEQPKCMSVSLEVIDNNDNSSIQSHYMALNDIILLDPCNFSDNKNPLRPGASCQQGFKNKNKTKKNIIKYIYLIIFIIIIILLFIRYH
jgi:hypothetical protein